MTFEATHNATSSPALADGLTHFDLQDGMTPDLFGPEAVPANHSAQPESKKASTTSGTFGPTGSISSASADLQSYLESRLVQQLKGAGSTLFSLTWKTKATSAGRPYCQLVASALRTSDNDAGSWPTARATDGEKNVRSVEGSRKEMERKGGPQDLNQAATLASWPTATKMDGNSSRRHGYMDKGHPGTTLSDAALMTSWPTPNAMPPNRGGLQSNPQKALERRQQGHQLNLDDAVCLTSWSTPSARDWKDTPGMATMGVNPDGSVRSRTDQLPRQVVLVSGQTLNGSPASTEKPGQLNPEFSLWLMGYPPEWASCAPQEMPSSRKRRLNSSKHQLDKAA